MVATVDDPLAASGVTTYSYDSAGRLTGRTDPAGATWTRTYEANTGQVDTQTITKGGKTLGSFNLDYDVTGNVTTRVEQVLDANNPNANLTGSGTWTYDYDAANRMKWSQDPSGTRTTYGYDGAGNRISLQVGSGPVQNTSYSSAGLPTSTGQTSFAHDLAGDLTLMDAPASDRAFAYDGYSRLVASCATTSVTPGCSGRVDYGYDAMARTVTRNGVNFSYRGLAEDAAKIGSLLIAQGPYGPLAQGSVGSASFYLKDLHSDIVGLYTGSTGNAGSKLYSPWGEAAASTGTTSDLGFQGDYTDPGTKQVDMGTRYYEPTMGRFTTQDVLFGEMTNPNSLNQYVYGVDSPLTYTDPTGMCNRVGHAGHLVSTCGNAVDKGAGSSAARAGSDSDWGGGPGATGTTTSNLPPQPNFPTGLPTAKVPWRTYPTMRWSDPLMDYEYQRTTSITAGYGWYGYQLDENAAFSGAQASFQKALGFGMKYGFGGTFGKNTSGHISIGGTTGGDVLSGNWTVKGGVTRVAGRPGGFVRVEYSLKSSEFGAEVTGTEELRFAPRPQNWYDRPSVMTAVGVGLVAVTAVYVAVRCGTKGQCDPQPIEKAADWAERIAA